MRVPASIRRVADRAGRLGRAAWARTANELVAGEFARQSRRNGAVPEAGVALFFPSAPDNLHCFNQWRRPLERLAAAVPVFVIVARPDTGARILAKTTLPVAFARSSAELESLVRGRDVRVVLYTNQDQNNFRMLRFTAPVHIQLGHGESDKVYSISNQHKAYDFTFVGGQAGADRLGQALRYFDPAARTIQVGRPQLDQQYGGGPDWSVGSGWRVWYAPTWEGDRPSAAYGSLVSHGIAIVTALLADPDVRLIYRPHPTTGRVSAAHGRADREIRALLTAAGNRHVIDEGEYGWQWAFADACVTDISSVAYDWLATGKPLVVTRPTAPEASWPPSRLLDSIPLLDAAEASQVVSLVRGAGPDPELRHYYFGATAGGASTGRFESAVLDVYAAASSSTGS